MTAATIKRYQQGGDIYAKLASQYGIVAANKIAAVAASDGDVTSAIAEVKNGPKLNESTADYFWGYIWDEPFNAPIEQGGKILSNASEAAGDAAKKIAGNWFTWLVVAAAIGAAFLYLGGDKVLRAVIAKKAR